MDAKHSDNELIKRLLDSNGSTSEEWYDRFFNMVLKYIKNHDGDLDDAKEVFHQGLLQLMIKAQDPGFEIKSTLEGYFLTICKNIWRRKKKIDKNRVTNTDYTTLVDEEREIAMATAEQDKWELFQEKLESLSENCRKVLSLYFKKIDYKTIADQLGYNTENVARQRKFKCEKKLREAIENDPKYNELKDS